MATMCNACGAIYELWSEAIECHPDVVDVSEEQYAEYKAAQQQRVPDVCPECAGSGKTGSIGLPRECPYCDGTGKRG